MGHIDEFNATLGVVISELPDRVRTRQISRLLPAQIFDVGGESPSPSRNAEGYSRPEY